MIAKLSEPDPVPGTSELPQISNTMTQAATAHLRSILIMQN